MQFLISRKAAKSFFLGVFAALREFFYGSAMIKDGIVPIGNCLASVA
jgi:hypothetical protein